MGVLEFVKYFRELIAELAQRPADDMLSGLIEVEERGDRLSTEELIVNLILLLAAGHGADHTPARQWPAGLVPSSGAVAAARRRTLRRAGRRE